MEVSLSTTAEVPHYFLCLISVEVMLDPVTLATGITYNRTSINAGSSPTVERFPTPRPLLDSGRVAALLDEGQHGRDRQAAAALREIKAFVAKSERNRPCVEATPGAVDFIASLVTKHSFAPSVADGCELRRPAGRSRPRAWRRCRRRVRRDSMMSRKKKTLPENNPSVTKI
ncbi:E3 ubiquitin-protein ligase PUB23-like [Miscanthus floridulus]|uniref:E3 ubiquitin-protein ligase PUB23-like n=1 Tax=Miscanthus floridulus TaxID=154761 RepID=UPI0034586D64